MFHFKGILGSALLAGGLLLAVTGSGCGGRVRVYDEYHSDYHHWNHDEDRAYRSYWNDRHQAYRDYNHLNKDERKDYWNWRHNHEDNDHH